MDFKENYTTVGDLVEKYGKEGMTYAELIQRADPVDLGSFLAEIAAESDGCPPSDPPAEQCRGLCSDCWIWWLRATIGDKKWEWRTYNKGKRK